MTTSTELIAESGLPEHEAVRLIASILDLDLSHVRGGVPLDPAQRAVFDHLVTRRRAGEPLQYLEGTAPFGPIDVEVDQRVLIPRPETEHLWELATAAMPDAAAVVVDIGTGSGALALATAHRHPEARVIATDISEEALEVARANADRLGLTLEFHHGDLFAALPEDLAGRVDVIVSNPPYITADEWDELPVEVREHEPRGALVGGADGLDVVRRLTAGASAWLRPGGRLLMEIGEAQGGAVMASLTDELIGRVEPDLTGRDRYLVAVRRSSSQTVPEPAIDAAMEAIRRGEVVGLPTDTVYGVAADPRQPSAVEQLFRAKGRPPDNPVAVLAASLEDAGTIGVLGEEAMDAARRHWPGALTIIVPMRVPLAEGVGDTARQTIGLRVPDHETTRRVLAATGPLAVTSANRSGAPPALDEEEAFRQLGEAVSIYVPGRCPGESASTVVDYTTDPPRMVRQGPVEV